LLTPDDQATLFPDFVCLGDELVIEFDEAYEPFKTDEAISIQQSSALADLDSFLEEHSGEQFERLYLSADGLREPEWNDIRSFAEKVLVTFNWPKVVPPSKSDHVIYVSLSYI